MNPTLLALEAKALPDARFRWLAQAMTIAILAMPKNPPAAFMDDCRALKRKLTARGRYLASLN